MDTHRPSSSQPLHVAHAAVAHGQPVDLLSQAVFLHVQDDVAIARTLLNQGLKLRLPPVCRRNGLEIIELAQRIPVGHKIALHAIAQGEPVRRYGSIIGFATQTIQPGEHVHTHNLAVDTLDQHYEYGIDVRPVAYVPSDQRRTFMGYRRPDGLVGTRNYVAIISSVNCSASAVRMIERCFGPELLRAYPNVDGVIGLTHKSGCGMQMGGDGIQQLQRVLTGMALHPNVGAYLFVGLGCEVNQLQELFEQIQLDEEGQWKTPLFLSLQEHHGMTYAVEEGARMVGELLPRVNMLRREPVSISELTLALQCGGSDSWSGITANPALGYCVDELVRQGGTAVLSETPEIYGAEHLLLRRARTREIGDQLVERLHWWEQYTAVNNMTIDNNPTPGNKQGGLTTIYEKSLGAIAKGGSTPVNAVYSYAEPITERGLVIMDTPGYDPVSVTGQVAGGANIVAFTTGRGSMFGYKPAPSIKIASNTNTYENLLGDMDINAGTVLDGVSIQEVGMQILDEIIAVASGKQSKSEAQDIGEEEFAPWILGATL
jgi:Altronate dehydratase